MWKEQTAICLGTPAMIDLPDLQLKSKQTQSLTHQRRRQKSTSGWDFSAATPTRGGPCARCVCRWVPGGSSGLSAGLWCGREPAGSCWWTEAAEKEKKNFDHKSFKNEKLRPSGDAAGKKNTWWMSSPTRSAPVGCLFIHLFNKRGSEKLWKKERRGEELPSVLSGSCSTCLWVTEWPNVFTFVWAWGCEWLFNCSVIYKEPHRQRQTMRDWDWFSEDDWGLMIMQAC